MYESILAKNFMINDMFNASEQPILVIGAAGTDMVGRLKSNLRPHTSNPAQIRLSFGGAARNVAENLLHLGTPVTLMTVLGSDEVGDRLIEDIRKAGANVEPVLRSTHFPSGSFLAVINTEGKLEYALDDMRVLSELSPETIHAHEDLFAQSSLLFLDANLPKETLRTILSVARKKKLPVCADPTSQELAIKLIPHLKHLRLVVPNSGEAAILCGQQEGINSRREAIEAAKCLVSRGVEIAII